MNSHFVARFRTLAALGFTLTAAAHLQAQLIEEVPFVTSPDNVTLEMLRIANVGPKDHVIDLGSGDGRIVITAARRFGATGLGVEIVPDLVDKSLRTARDAGVAEKADFRVQDLFKTDLKPATVVTMYLLPEVNLQLRPALLALKPGTRVVSHDWDMGDWKPDQTTQLDVPDKKVGLQKSSKIHLWVVPARVEGLWCGTGPAQGSQLRLAQRYQEVEGTISQAQAKRSQAVKGRMEGAALKTDGSLALVAAGESLRLTGGLAAFGLAPRAEFKRSGTGRCA
jgi:SAM-dependent methyltransferase